LLAPVWGIWRPTQVLAVAPETAVAQSAVPLLADRLAKDGSPTAYVCRNFACNLPVTDATALIEQLSRDR
jgi:uncharacterized protein YyaL (SSP411 family)